jgi:hypothetical protein
MSFSYGFGANPSIDNVRFLVGDTVDDGHIFEDSEITMASSMCSFACIYPTGGGQGTTSSAASPFFVAASMLESLSAVRARSAIKKLLDVELDGKTASQALRDVAKCLRESEQMSGAFAIIEQAGDAFAMRQRLYAQVLRLRV